MNDDESRYREAFEAILEIAKRVSNRTNGDGGDVPGCRIMELPGRLRHQAAGVAAAVNPVNAPLRETAGLGSLADAPQRLTLVTTKYWGPTPKQLTVSFMETTPTDLRDRILSHMNAWSALCGMRFVSTAGIGDIRISRGGGGYWSYLGTDIKLIPTNRQTMNLQGFTMSTPESEYKRVVRHETGHSMGFPHDHLRKALIDRIDPQKAYPYFLQTQGWDKAMVDAQVLTPLDPRTIVGTEADEDSIMCYQLPASITRDGRPIRGGTDINAADAMLAGLVYPKVLNAPGQVPQPRDTGAAATPDGEGQLDWDPSEDVAVPA